MIDYAELKTTLVPGKSFCVFYDAGNPNNCIAHIRAIVDDDWIVWRRWIKTKRAWAYRVDYIYFFWLLNQDGHLVKRGSKEHRGT